MFFDTHTHASYAPLDTDEEGVFRRISESGVRHTLQIGCDVMSSKKAIDLALRHSGHFASVGMHPVDAQIIDETDMQSHICELMDLIDCSGGVVRAIGETGLDNYHLPIDNPHQAQQNQERWFRAHLEMANKYHLPLVIHTREARDRTYDILSEIITHGYHLIPHIIMHCYSEDYAYADRLIELFGDRIFFAFGGILTYRSRNEHIQDAAMRLPIEQILVETDAPFLIPYDARKHGAKHNEPCYVGEVSHKLATLRHMEHEEMMPIVFANSLRALSLGQAGQ